MILYATVALVFAYLLKIVISLLIRNHNAHKFFKTKSPNLPVVPNPNIFAGHSLKIITSDKNWKIIEDLHDIYGSTFGYYMVGQPWVSTKDINLIRLIEVDEAHKHMSRPFFGLPIRELNHSIFQVNGKRWQKVRRAISSALTNRSVKSSDVSSDIELIVNELAASMKRRANESLEATGGKLSSFILDSRNFFERYTLAVIMLTTYRQKDVIDFDSDRDAWIDGINGASPHLFNPLVIISLAAPELTPICEWINQFTVVGKMWEKVVNFTRAAIESNKLARDTKPNKTTENYQKPNANGAIYQSSFSQISSEFKHRMIDTIIDAANVLKIDHDDLLGTLAFLLVAGFQTTADTLSCLIWHLAKNKVIQQKLRRTIQEEGIDADYLMWCINETIRYHPSVPLGGGRVLGEDVEFDGLLLPKGTFVMPTVHGIHHDPTIWPEPELFIPERWRDQANFHPAAFVGFGLGPRNCPGGKLAVHEIKLALQMILTNYMIEECDQTPIGWHFTTPGLVYTLNDDPINVRFIPLAADNCNQAAA